MTTKVPPKGKGKFDLTKKVGPLALWQWGAIALGGALLWRHFHPAATPTDTTSGATDSQGQLAPVDSSFGAAPISGSGGGGFDSGGSTGTSDGSGLPAGDPAAAPEMAPLTGALDPLTGTLQLIAPRHRHHKPPPKPHGHKPRPPHHPHYHGGQLPRRHHTSGRGAR